MKQHSVQSESEAKRQISTNVQLLDDCLKCISEFTTNIDKFLDRLPENTGFTIMF